MYSKFIIFALLIIYIQANPINNDNGAIDDTFLKVSNYNK